MSSDTLLASAFLAGILYGYLVLKSESRPIQLRIFKPPKPDPVEIEQRETEGFIAAMWDDTGDHALLKSYKSVKVRNRPPLAIAATPSPTVQSMASIRTWMGDHGMHDLDRRPNLSKVASNTRRRR